MSKTAKISAAVSLTFLLLAGTIWMLMPRAERVIVIPATHAARYGQRGGRFSMKASTPSAATGSSMLLVMVRTASS